MDFKSIVDFNKYTLALAAGSLAYTVEKFEGTKDFFILPVALTLFVLLVSIVFGILVFATATKALHSDDSKAYEELISVYGTRHAISLTIGIILLVLLVLPLVFPQITLSMG